MMHPQVFLLSLILLLPGSVETYKVVKGMVGHPATLPCTYSTVHGVTTTCWGRGECQHFYCARTLIWTNGHRVTYQSSNRYQLKGNMLEGNVSLTIENPVQSDSGPYCCIVEIPGSFSYETISFEVMPEILTSHPTRPTTTTRPMTILTRPPTTTRPPTFSTRPTHGPTSTRVSTSTPPTLAYTQTEPETTTFTPYETTAEVTETRSYIPTDWNNTVTSTDDSWNYSTEVIPMPKSKRNMTKCFYVGISIAALVLLLLLLSTVAITRHVLMKKKSRSLSLVAFPAAKIGALLSTVVVPARGEARIYIIEDSRYLEE
ncbi:hepatitis A virus cellular receptor 1 homolog [Psammomys obesus]|uniref:hepatitis A virus cellular receptor 1 homolog n=1 Tax=Psammomys obesus TaxID=48139 RepID=UPI0024529047|nr:hepatitis A virus cellular receptor 1 homolog [Psammomys obesus]